MSLTKIKAQNLKVPATQDNFDEFAYLNGNLDVQDALLSGKIKSGLEHFKQFGINENRHLLFEVEASMKKDKLNTIRSLLNDSMKFETHESHYDFLTNELRDVFNIIDTNAVSSNDYDEDVLALIEKYKEGFILDCGAGSRGVYYPNVVNFEIAVYPSTDVRGVGEKLPFKDNSFDAVISIAVLEHVKDPWLCAKEILRVLKPGGDLICCVPFLQPLHGYPHHYYNMTDLGLRNLFGSGIAVIDHKVPASTSPIWALTWILNSWVDGLSKESRNEFLNLSIKDLITNPQKLLQKSYVINLSKEKNLELASATVLHAIKNHINV
jgi:SAM-dependent methyltransferase